MRLPLPVRSQSLPTRHALARSLALLAAFGCAAGAWSAPLVSSFNPTLGGPGTQVTVLGHGFGSATQVHFGDAPADFTALADNRLIAVVPPEATSGRIRVANPTGTGTSASDFMAAPRVTSFAPARSATNTAVTIDGANFLSVTNVQFAGHSAGFSITAGTQIRATVPFGATNGPIRVSSPAGSAMSAEAFVVTGPEPILDSFEPPIGLPGTEVLIQGANFTNVTAVRFNNTNATTFAAPAHTQLRALVPNGATTGKIVVVTPGGSATSIVDFIVSGRPYLRAFNPRYGRDGFTQVTIEGLNFTGISGVGFNGKPVTGIATPAENQLLVTVPTGATTGLITVTNASGFGSSAEPFVITLAPIIEDFTPIQGGPGTPVTISGVNFSNGPTSLFFGGVPASFAYTGLGGTQIRATVPNGARSGPLTMTNTHGAFATSNSFFVSGTAPFVTALSPSSGPRGAEVILTGGNFTSPATVRFNGVPDPTSAVTALTQIRATVPAGALTGPVTVTTSAGTSTNGPIFYVPPRLTSMTPTEGVVGDPVVLSGTNFPGTSQVLFNGLNAVFEVTASNRITAVVPDNAGTGPITVVAPGGVIVSTNNFKVLPQILSFDPLLGPAGTVVTVHGTTFTNVTGVTFNNIPSSPTLVSRTELRAPVPGQTTTGPIRVTTVDGTAVSPTPFLVTRGSDLALSKTVDPPQVQPGQTFQYALVASNLGASVVTGVQILDNLPSGLQVLEMSIERGTVGHTNGVVTGNIGALTNGTSVTLTISVLANTMGVFTNHASVESVEGDPNLNNNEASVAVVVLTDAARTLEIEAGAGPFVVIRWPIAPVQLTLESTPNLEPDHLWTPVPAPPVVIQGHNVVTDDASGERYYRLRGPP